ncbi:glycosyltransferase family 4 protein [Rubrivivax gelatinosus]|uniref:glycosyltransferase family 4 protein n=1 Tax=Rubrivivax gelatinosus TaxID=28068 RepID=UPI001ED8E157|nr:glycosyltransferase family 4 protein [Rubrivivax gelatinosus]
MRIALVGPLPPPEGGMANQTRQLGRLLSDAGARVEIVQTNSAYRPGWVEAVPVLRAGFRLVPYLWRLWRAAGRSDLMHVMANSGWSWHLFAMPAIRIAAARSVPVVVNYRGGEAAPFLQTAARSVKATLAHAALLIVPSGFLREVFSRHGIAAEIVPNIVDQARFRPSAQAGTGGPHLIVARNLEPIYDNATAIRALALVLRRHPGARLSIAGTGPEREALAALARELGVADAVEFLGRLDREAMAALYARADLMLNPSTVDNMPNSVLEALSAAVPVVSTDVGGVPFLVEHGSTALLVPPRDPEAMALAVCSVTEDAALASRLRANGLVTAGRYTWEAVRAHLESAYARAIALRKC